MKLSNLLFPFLVFLIGCSGKYLIKTYPSGAKVYVRDIRTKEKKLIGLSPAQIKEESRLGDVFFVVLEKQNYKPKEIMIRVNEGESLTVTAQLDPMTGEELREAASVAGKKEDKGQPPMPPQDNKKKTNLKEEVEDLQLRVALLENTVSFYKDALFSPRFKGGPASFDRDRNDKVIGYMFQAQQAVVRANYKKALELLDKVVQIDEYVSNAWLLKGSVKYLQKDYEGARLAWERCLKIDPHNQVAYRYLSTVYEKLGLEKLPRRPEALRYPAVQMEIEKRR
ncbi:MAG: hypothetical protein D6797_00405, partial [Bdellovibrio sp.]